MDSIDPLWNHFENQKKTWVVLPITTPKATRPPVSGLSNEPENKKKQNNAKNAMILSYHNISTYKLLILQSTPTSTYWSWHLSPSPGRPPCGRVRPEKHRFRWFGWVFSPWNGGQLEPSGSVKLACQVPILRSLDKACDACVWYLVFTRQTTKQT